MDFSWIDHRVVIAWLIGIACYPVVELVYCKVLKKEYKPMLKNPRAVRNIALAFVVLFTIGVQLYITNATNQNRQCVHQLTGTLSTEQALAKRERDALTSLFFAAVNPPPEIAALPQEDPARKEWGQKLGNDYLANVKKIGVERDANEVQQKSFQKTCG